MIVTTLLLACADPSAGVAEAPTWTAEVGGTAPDFAMPGPDGGAVRLSDHAGDVIMLTLYGFT